MNQPLDQTNQRSGRNISDETKPIVLLTTPLNATLFTGLAVVVAGCLWSVLARIPITVNGTGILLPVGAINTRISPSYGTAFWMFHRPIANWERLAWQFKNNPDSLTNLEVEKLATSIASDLSAERLYSRSANNASASALSAESLRQLYRSKSVPAGKLILLVHSSEQIEKLFSSIDKLRSNNAEAAAKLSNARLKERQIVQELNSATSYLGDMQSLSGDGYVSKTTILQQRTAVDNLNSQLLDTKNTIVGLNAQIKTGYQNMRDVLAELITQIMIFNMGTSYLAQIVPNDGETVMQGQPILQLSQNPLDSPVYVPVFLDSQEMAQVFPGMPILATPLGYQRSEVGGIRGKVISISKLPSDVDDLTALVGVKSLAAEIFREQGAPSLAVVSLDRPKNAQSNKNSGGYLWSSQSALPFPPKAGDKLSVEITTQSVSPISLVIPALKKFIGITPPQQIKNRNANNEIDK